MRAIIADDEPNLANDLRKRIMRLWPELEIVAVLHDGVAAQQSLLSQKPDIAFLDIQMPGMNGLDVAQAAPPTCRVVFVTAYDEHAVKAFEQAAIDYLLKPVSDERLARCVDRLRQHASPDYPDMLAQLTSLMQANTNPAPLRWLRVQQGQNVRLLPVEEVCYFQSDEKYTAVVTREGEWLLRTPIKELIQQLDSSEFWQVHRGTVVNVRQIAAAHHDAGGKVTLRLRDRKEMLPVSRSYAHLFRQM